MKEKCHGKHFAKKSKLKVVRILFSRTGMIALSVLIQFLFFFLAFAVFAERSQYFWVASIVLAIIMVLVIVNSKSDPTAKLTWTVLVLLLPFFGAPFYFFTRSDLGHRTLKKRFRKQMELSQGLLTQSEEVLQSAAEIAKEAVSLSVYLGKSGSHPLYFAENVSYLPSGESKFEALLKAIENAQHFIFLEYFIIAKGRMWNEVLDLLKQKASEGVEVRILYDGTCEFSSLSRSYSKELARYGIACKVFSSIKPFISTHYNYRDHRKIAVIDGKVGITGGINLADEYINQVNRFGHWKDSAVMIEGTAVNSLTLLFLQMWNLDAKTPEYEPYLHNITSPEKKAEGFVMPFGDCPLDDYKAGEMVYIDMLNRAEHYVHIMTPYLILDGEIESAIKFAAERGVEVKIIFPSVPDKKMPYALARTHFPSLIASGVMIYEYTPGFIHSKVCVADGKRAVVGTINFDYRSFYHHFECAAYLHSVQCIADIDNDFEKICTASKEITPDELPKQKKGYALLGALFKLLAPLL